MKVTYFAAMIAALVISMAGCVSPLGYNLPPAERLFHPGPGVDGPGPGVIPPPGPDLVDPANGGPSAAALAAASGGGVETVGGEVVAGGEYCPPGGGGGGGFLVGVQRTVQVFFARPDGMQVRFDVTGQSNFDSEPLIAPARQNFTQAGIYRFKLTNIPDHEGVELYPTLEIGPVTPRTTAYLSHNAIPVQFTPEDFDQVLAGNYVTKVIYLPDPEFQVLAVAGGADTLVNTKLLPGEDPIVEADQRGSIMAVVRIGNLDIESLSAEGGETYLSSDISTSKAGQSGVAQASGIRPVGSVAYPQQAAPGGAAPQQYARGAMAPQRFAQAGSPYYGGVMTGPTAAYGSPYYYGAPGAATVPPGYIAGVTTQPYGMPITGTPIGLPGPPHMPLGGKAGLKFHGMKNSTHRHFPQPTPWINIHVKQRPGYSYPTPANRLKIMEQNIHYTPAFRQPHSDKRMLIR